MLLTPFAADAEDEATKKFVAAYKEAYKETPNQFAADAYDAVYTIKAAIEQAAADGVEITPETSASDICDALKTAITKINLKGLTGGEEGLTWNEKGEVNKEPKAVIIKDGVYVGM